jgi:hypothetical protein
MDKKIWAFGDSHTQSLEPVSGLSDYRFKYKQYKGRSPKVFADFLKEDYGYECYNGGLGGADNYTILDLITLKSTNVLCPATNLHFIDIY